MVVEVWPTEDRQLAIRLFGSRSVTVCFQVAYITACTNTRRCKLVVCKQSYIKTELVVGLVGAGGWNGSGRGRGAGQRGMGEDVLWEIPSRRTMATATVPFQCCMNPHM